MTKLLVGFCAAAVLVLGLSFIPTLTYAQESEAGGNISEATTKADCKKAGGHWKAKKEKCVEKKQKKESAQ